MLVVLVQLLWLLVVLMMLLLVSALLLHQSVLAIVGVSSVDVVGSAGWDAAAVVLWLLLLAVAVAVVAGVAGSCS